MRRDVGTADSPQLSNIFEVMRHPHSRLDWTKDEYNERASSFVLRDILLVKNEVCSYTFLKLSPGLEVLCAGGSSGLLTWHANGCEMVGPPGAVSGSHELLMFFEVYNRGSSTTNVLLIQGLTEDQAPSNARGLGSWRTPSHGCIVGTAKRASS